MKDVSFSNQSLSPVNIEQQLQHAFQLRLVDMRQSIHLTQELLSSFPEDGFENEKARTKNQLGLFYLIQGEFQKSYEFSEEALRFFEKKNNPSGIADAKYNIASIFYRTNKYHEGLIYLLDCLQIYRSTSDYYNQARTLKSAGTIYEYFNDLEKAVEYYEKSIEASIVIGDRSTESNALNPLSGIYAKQGLIPLAMETIERSIQLKKETKDIRGLAYAYYGRGKINIRQGNFNDALPDLEESIRILSNEGDKLGLGMAYNKMGIAWLGSGNAPLAKEYFLKAHDLAKKYNVQFILFKVSFNLYQLAKQEGDAARALFYLEKYFLDKESVINKETYNIIKSYEATSRIEALEREGISQREKNEIIENKNAELDSFFYRVSHDLKGPISSLLGLNTIVKMDISHEPSLYIFNMYHAQVLRMNDIVMGLINLTEIKNTEKLKSSINFGRLVDECIDSCRYLPQASTIRIEKDIENFEFYSEWAIINTILQNLIENSIKYSRPNAISFVKIKIYSQVSKVHIVVEDNGQGIPPSHQNNIFNMFYRATSRVQGSGLGLYILKRAVERLKGTIDLQSVENEGSVFTIMIPFN
jgi:signal transduction histidine kinase